MNELQLVVTKNIVGQLETNIDALECFVKERLEQYSPELYKGDAVSAKKDRAELNSAKSQIADSRKTLMKELMKPYSDFESRCKQLEKDIENASCKLNEVVKAKESEEKSAKKQLIIGIWEQKNFKLFALEKVFNEKWLNKTVKLTDVENEIDTIIKRTYSDLKVIEKYTDDAETLKAMYLETLNIGDTLDRGEELKKNREKIAEESSERPQREHEEKIAEQKKEVCKENAEYAKKSSMENLIAEALDEEVTPVKKEYVVSFSATAGQVLALKNFLTMQGIEYSSFKELKF